MSKRPSDGDSPTPKRTATSGDPIQHDILSCFQDYFAASFPLSFATAATDYISSLINWSSDEWDVYRISERLRAWFNVHGEVYNERIEQDVITKLIQARSQWGSFVKHPPPTFPHAITPLPPSGDLDVPDDEFFPMDEVAKLRFADEEQLVSTLSAEAATVLNQFFAAGQTTYDILQYILAL